MTLRSMERRLMEKGKLLRRGTERVQEFLLKRIEYFPPSSQSLEIIEDQYTHYIWKYGWENQENAERKVQRGRVPHG